MAEAVAEGIHAEDGETEVKLFNIAEGDKNDVITEIFRAKGVLLGSPTINKGILTAMAALLEEAKGLGFEKKKAAGFGCYGWSGESVAILTEQLKAAGFETVDGGLKALWNPDEEALEAARQYGRNFAKQFEPVPVE